MSGNVLAAVAIVLFVLAALPWPTTQAYSLSLVAAGLAFLAAAILVTATV
jgi:hypothetical protein